MVSSAKDGTVRILNNEWFCMHESPYAFSVFSLFLTVKTLHYKSNLQQDPIFEVEVISDALNFEVNTVVTQYCVYFEI